jgi:hypothetical protein
MTDPFSYSCPSVRAVRLPGRGGRLGGGAGRDVAITWNKTAGQTTVRAEITENTLRAVPAILDPTQDGFDDTDPDQPDPWGLWPTLLDGIAGGFLGVLAAGRGGPPDVPVGQLVDPPPGVLFDPMVVAALWVGVTQAGPAARLERDVVLEL